MQKVLTFKDIKPGCDHKEVTTLQKKVNHVFEDFSESEADKPFLEFHDESIEERSKLTLALAKDAKEKGLEHAIQICLDDLKDKKMNPSLVQSAFAVFLTHNKDAQKLGVIVPPLALYAKFKRIKKPLANPVTPDTLRGMNVIAYWREDYDLNDHHNHWHQVYPTSGIPDGNGGMKRTIKRQGELFLYMHSQMIARYNAELLAWDLDIVHPFGYDDVLTFGYLPPPGLQHKYSSRPAYQGWFENHNPDITDSPPPPKEDLIKWRNNIFKAMEDGFFRTEGGGKYVVDEENMMNTVGLALEAVRSTLQEVEPGVFLDRVVYGNLHNQGHNKFSEIGYISGDPPQYGVMGDTQVAVRDPVFWMWHKHIDNFRQEVVKKYTNNLKTYKPDAEIVSVILVPQNSGTKTSHEGIATYMCPPDLELNEVHAKLRHEPYEWKVTVKSTLSTPPTGTNPQTFTVRLFIAPEELIQDQRSWIEMDKFTYQLTQKQDTIVRKDTESSVARQVKQYSSDSRCSCGWPQNLMLPAGKPEGMPYAIFAMLTNDQLDTDNYTTSISFCGAKDDDYPDPRGMGYPFDKTWNDRVNSTASVESIIERQPHIKLGHVTIYRYMKPYEEDKEQDSVVAAFKNWMSILL